MHVSRTKERQDGRRCTTTRFDSSMVVRMTAADPEGPELTLQDVRLLAPVTPSKIFCVGRNYAAHRSEMGYEHDDAPSVFMKGPSTIIGPGENIVLPPLSMSTHVEHEAELAIVIGKPARFVSAAEATDYILGYTCANDVSARDLQRGDPHPTRGKGFDTFCPVRTVDRNGARPGSRSSPAMQRERHAAAGRVDSRHDVRHSVPDRVPHRLRDVVPR